MAPRVVRAPSGSPAPARSVRSISVGNLRVGGAGKTPIVEYLARLLAAGGERPAILTRGYGRRCAPAGVTIVSDGTRVLAGVDTAGDEPLMLARAVPGVIVAVGADRYLSGRVAERQLGATVHILDDGFQHFAAGARRRSARDGRSTTSATGRCRQGRLREGLAGRRRRADAAIVDAGYLPAAERVGRALGVPRVFRVTRLLGPPRMVRSGDTVVVPEHSRVFATAAIARPERFFSDLVSAEWQVVGTMPFRDHHQFTRARRRADCRRRRRPSSAAIVLTTDKDAVRFAVCDLGDLPIAAVPLSATVEPADEFRAWLFERLWLAGRLSEALARVRRRAGARGAGRP